MKLLIRSIIATALVFCGACSLFTPSSPFDVQGLTEGTIEEKNRVEKLLEKRASEINSYRSLLNVTLQEGAFRDHVKEALVFSRPDRLRFEFFERSINQLLVLVTANKQALKAYDYREKLAYVGSPTRANLYRLLSVPLAPEQIMLLFTGRFSPRLVTET